MTVILSLDEIKKCIGLDKQLIPIIEEAFKNLAQDKVSMPPILRLDIEEYHGESDVKAAYIQGLDSYAIKVASGFFNNSKIYFMSRRRIITKRFPITDSVYNSYFVNFI